MVTSSQDCEDYEQKIYANVTLGTTDSSEYDDYFNDDYIQNDDLYDDDKDDYTKVDDQDDYHNDDYTKVDDYYTDDENDDYVKSSGIYFEITDESGNIKLQGGPYYDDNTTYHSSKQHENEN